MTLIKSGTLVKSGEINISDPIGSILEIESHLLSTRTADMFRGIDNSDGSSLSFWLLREKLDSDQRDKFINRLSLIESLRLPNCPLRGFGVDAEGQAFALFPTVDANLIVSANSGILDLREAERRFTPCLQTIEKLHQAGVVLGDVCSSSFVLDRSGRVLFIGVMGGIETGLLLSNDQTSYQAAEQEMLLPETLQFISPEQRAGSLATQASDVFAIGVLGYRLFGGKFPFSGLSVSQLTNPRTIYPPVAPLVSPTTTNSAALPTWCSEVFLKCLHSLPEVRYPNAIDLNVDIQSLRQKALFASEAPLVVNRGLSSDSKFKQQSGTSTFDPLSDKSRSDKTQIKRSLSKPLFALICLGLISFLAGIGYLILSPESPLKDSQTVGSEVDAENDSGNEGTSNPASVEVIQELLLLADAASDPKLKNAITALAQSNLNIEQRAPFLDALVASDDALSHQALVASAVVSTRQELRDQLQKAISNRVLRLGSLNTAEQLRQWLSTIPVGTLPENYEAVLKLVNPRQPLAVRESLLRQAYPKDQKSVLLFAAALALDSGEPQMFQPVVSQLVGDSLGISDSAQKSSFALLLAHPQIAEVYGDALVSRKSELSDSDLPWILSILATREDLNVRQIAQLTLERGQISSLRKVFLDAIKERDNLSPEVVISLVRAGSGTVTSADIAQFGLWVDGLSEKVLLALCAELKDQKLLVEAFDTLAAKPLTILPIVSLIENVRQKYWERRADLAPLVAVVGLPGLASEDQIIPMVNNLEDFKKDSKLFEALVTSSDPQLTNAILDRYFDDLGLGALLKLLRNNDKEVRIKAILALKRYNEIGALKLIIAEYEKEKDPDVIKVYRESFWMIAERKDK